MSQTYRISLKSSVSKVIKAEDSISYPLELTEIMPLEDMKEAFVKGLLERGFTQVSEKVYEMTLDNGEVLSVDTDSMTLTASLKAEKEVAAEVEVSGRGNSKSNANKDAQSRLSRLEEVTEERIENQGREDLGKELSEKLTETEAQRLKLINEILQDVYSQSLKKKAATLGNVMEIREGTNEDGQYELDIKVEL